MVKKSTKNYPENSAHKISTLADPASKAAVSDEKLASKSFNTGVLKSSEKSLPAFETWSSFNNFRVKYEAVKELTSKTSKKPAKRQKKKKTTMKAEKM